MNKILFYMSLYFGELTEDERLDSGMEMPPKMDKNHPVVICDFTETNKKVWCTYEYWKTNFKNMGKDKNDFINICKEFLKNKNK